MVFNHLPNIKAVMRKNPLRLFYFSQIQIKQSLSEMTQEGKVWQIQKTTKGSVWFQRRTSETFKAERDVRH